MVATGKPGRRKVASAGKLTKVAKVTCLVGGLVAVGCGGGKGTGGRRAPDDDLPSSDPSRGDVSAIETPRASSLPPAIAPLPGDGERAYVVDATGLVEVGPKGAQLLSPDGASWCGVDARAQVVWFANSDELVAFDLVDRRLHPILTGELGELAVMIDWGKEHVGGEDRLSFDVAAAIRMRSAPAIELEMGCDGDAAFHCYEDDGTTPREAIASLQALVPTLKLVDPAYVAALASRGREGALWRPAPPAPPRPKVKPAVDRRECTEDRSTCGQLTVVPASPLWLVQTANSRGDYYHESRELWDPATAEFVRRDGAVLRRSKRVPSAHEDSSDYGGMRVSPTGNLTAGGAVFDAGKVWFAPKVDDRSGPAISCGWAEGGWRIDGPTDF